MQKLWLVLFLIVAEPPICFVGFVLGYFIYFDSSQVPGSKHPYTNPSGLLFSGVAGAVILGAVPIIMILVWWIKKPKQQA